MTKQPVTLNEKRTVFSINGVEKVGSDQIRSDQSLSRVQLLDTCKTKKLNHYLTSVQSLICVQLFETPWTAARQASVSITNSQRILRLMSMESVMPSNISSSVIPFSSCFQSFPASGFFQWVSSSHLVAKVLEFQLQHQYFQWIFRTDFLWDGLVGSPCSPRDSQASSTTQFKSINSSGLSFL